MRFLVSILLLCVGIVNGQSFGQMPINNAPLINNPLMNNNNNPLMMMNGLPNNRPLTGMNQILPNNPGVMAMNNPLSQQALPPQQNLFPQQQPQPIFTGLPNDRIRELALQAAQPTLQQWSNNDYQMIFQRAGALNPLPNQAGGGAPPLIEGVRMIQSMPSTLTALQQQLQSPIGQDLLLTNPNLSQWMQQQQLLMQQALNNNNIVNNNINRPPMNNPLDPLQQQAPMMPINNNNNINNPTPIMNAPSLQGLNPTININRPPIQDFTLMQPGGPINNPPSNNINPQQPINNAPQPNINAPVPPANAPRPRP